MQIIPSRRTLFMYSNMAPQRSHNNSQATLWAVTLAVTFPPSVNQPATHDAARS